MTCAKRIFETREEACAALAEAKIAQLRWPGRTRRHEQRIYDDCLEHPGQYHLTSKEAW